MKRRKFIQAVGVASASGLHGGCGPKADTPSRVNTPSPSVGTQAADVQASSVPDFARKMRSSDLHGLGEDGKPDPNYSANDTGHGKRYVRMALERGGSFRVGLEDWGTGPSNVEQIERAKETIDAVDRPIVTGAEAIRYLDIPFAATWPGTLP